jgi:geranylgeranyl diphosphate synthase type II
MTPGSSTDSPERGVPAHLWAELEPRLKRVRVELLAQLAVYTLRTPLPLFEAMKYCLITTGGKRLRPLLAVLACEAAGGTIEQALPAAVAVEMVHTYSLIHDDLPAMDDDDLRRGMPTCHKKFGEALAILAGDALLTLAFEVLCRVKTPRTAAVSCMELAKGAGAVGMVGGQTLDLIADGRIEANGRREPAGMDDLADIHVRKTGALFRVSLRLGVYAAQAERPEGVNPDTLAAADDYASAFGLLFQVTDDLLDVEGTADKAGKRVGKDAARGKLTYPALLGVEESRRKAAELGKQAVAAAERLGSPLLAALAQYVVQRDR